MTPVPPLSAAIGALLVLAASLPLGLLPARLLRETQAEGGHVRWLGSLVRPAPLAALTATVGLATYAGGLATLGPWTAGGLAVAAACLAGLLVVDADRMIIPDLYPLALLVLAFVGPLARSPGRAAIDAVGGFILLFLVREGFRRLRQVEAVGWGDLKLVAALAALVGAQAVLWVIAAGSILGVVWAVVRARGRLDQAGPVPFGAALVAPAAVAILLSALAR